MHRHASNWWVQPVHLDLRGDWKVSIKERARDWLISCHCDDTPYCTPCEIIRDLYEECYNVSSEPKEADNVESDFERSEHGEGSVVGVEVVAGIPGAGGHEEGEGPAGQGEEVNEPVYCNSCDLDAVSECTC